MKPRFLAYVALAALALPAGAGADVVLDWNQVLLGAIRVDRTNPPKASRAMAIVHVSIFDAVDSILGGFERYHFAGSAPGGASAEAAAAAAAHRALVALFPAQQATFDAALAASLAAIPDGAAETSGVAFGRTVADDILALRANDGSAVVLAYDSPDGAGWWVPTPPAFAPALQPNWPTVTPWCLETGSKLRPNAPPAPNSAEYAVAFQEVKRLGRSNSPSRTADQTQIALFWADGAGTVTPPGHWLNIAAGLSQDEHLSLLQNARLFALLGITVADAAIVSWDIKYAYGNWRPVTGIQHADIDGNPATFADANWLPLISTPPFPSYSSGHSTFSASSARLLSLFFGTDHIDFSTTSDGLPGVTRSYDSFSQAAAEAGQSRIYGGIHWQFDNQAGQATGRELAEHVFFNNLGPTESPSICVANSLTHCLVGDRFRVSVQWATEDASGVGHAVELTDDSGGFWFFEEDNIELTVKVLNACGEFDRFWVFASGMTNVQYTLTVTDTQTGRVRRYFNPLGKASAPVQDVDAFATCP